MLLLLLLMLLLLLLLLLLMKPKEEGRPAGEVGGWWREAEGAIRIWARVEPFKGGGAHVEGAGNLWRTRVITRVEIAA